MSPLVGESTTASAVHLQRTLQQYTVRPVIVVELWLRFALGVLLRPERFRTINAPFYRLLFGVVLPDAYPQNGPLRSSKKKI